MLLAWGKALASSRYRNTLIVVLVILALQFVFMSNFFTVVQQRQGAVFIDPLLVHFEAIEVDMLTFVSVYLAHAVAIVAAAALPKVFLRLAAGYFLVYFFRIFSIWLLPLEPPGGTIALTDPLLYWFGQGQQITRDLFYSGHTSSVFMAFLTTVRRPAKVLILCCLVAVVFGVLAQKVHWTIDVYAAFFFAYTAYRLADVSIGKLTS